MSKDVFLEWLSCLALPRAAARQNVGRFTYLSTVFHLGRSVPLQME